MNLKFRFEVLLFETLSDQIDTDYKSNESPYQSNEVVYSAMPGPPAPPIRSSDSSHFQSSPKSAHSIDSNYEVRLFQVKINH